MHSFLKWIANKKFILVLLLGTAIFASAQSLLLGKKTYVEGGIAYNSYNNYTIFKQSFYHLLDDQDLYSPYPTQHWDIYKYSPAFALLFGVFAILPDILGLSLWNILNVLVIFFAVYYIPHLTKTQKAFILLACVIESMTAIQNEQSNGMVAGLIIFAFGLCERKKFFLAALCLVLTVFIKLFGLVAFAMFLFYPGKWRFALYSLATITILLLLPLLVIDLNQLKFLYTSWGQMLSQDHSVSEGLSVMGWLETWFSIFANKVTVALIGAAIFLLPFLRIRMYNDYFFRLLALASVLVWIVIFNHKAESPTFIIAMSGVSIWFFSSKTSWLNVSLFILSIILTTLSPTDIFPSFLRKGFIEPYVLKVVPCILIWGKIIYDMLLLENADQAIIERRSESKAILAPRF